MCIYDFACSYVATELYFDFHLLLSLSVFTEIEGCRFCSGVLVRLTRLACSTSVVEHLMVADEVLQYILSVCKCMVDWHSPHFVHLRTIVYITLLGVTTLNTSSIHVIYIDYSALHTYNVLGSFIVHTYCINCLDFHVRTAAGSGSPTFAKQNVFSDTTPHTCYGCKKALGSSSLVKTPPNLFWHADCLFCCECRVSLSDGPSCHMNEGNTYCKRDYLK